MVSWDRSVTISHRSASVRASLASLVTSRTFPNYDQLKLSNRDVDLAPKSLMSEGIFFKPGHVTKQAELRLRTIRCVSDGSAVSRLSRCCGYCCASSQQYASDTERGRIPGRWQVASTDCRHGLLPGPFLLSYSVFVFTFSLIFRFWAGPCGRLSWPSRQLLGTR